MNSLNQMQVIQLQQYINDREKAAQAIRRLRQELANLVIAEEAAIARLASLVNALVVPDK